MKRRVQQVIVFILAMLILCPSFCISAYAYADSEHSKYYDEEDDEYRDSYIVKEGGENSRLVFYPPFPESEYNDYVLMWDKEVDQVSLLIFTSKHQYDLYFHKSSGKDWFPNFKNYEVYTYNPILRAWEYSYNDDTCTFSGGPWWYDGYVIDSSCRLSSGNVIDIYGYTNVTGYRFYWKLIRVEKFLLKQVSKMADYILANQILRLFVLVGFCGEMIVFAVVLIKKLGRRRDTVEED